LLFRRHPLPVTKDASARGEGKQHGFSEAKHGLNAGQRTEISEARFPSKRNRLRWQAATIVSKRLRLDGNRA